MNLAEIVAVWGPRWANRAIDHAERLLVARTKSGMGRFFADQYPIAPPHLFLVPANKNRLEHFECASDHPKHCDLRWTAWPGTTLGNES